MKISLNGIHMDLGESFSQYVQNTLSELVLEKFEKATSAHISVTKENYNFFVKIIVNLGHPFNGISEADDEDAYKAFNKALNKLETQLERHKNKIRTKHKQKLSEISDIENIIQGTYYTINEDYDEDDVDMPIIIAEKPTDIMILTVSEAVIKMDLAGLSVLMFINKKTRNINTVCRREDGNISWIESNISYDKNKLKAKS